MIMKGKPMNKVKVFIPLVLCGALFGCSSKDKNNTNAQSAGPSIEAQQIAAQNEAAAFIEIPFAKGKAGLSKNSRQQIDELLAKAPDKDKIESVKVISWADLEYPSVQSTKLPKGQIKLAERRLDSVTDYLKKKADGVDVEKFNMAERPTALQRFFETDDARIKNSLESLGIPNTDTAVKEPRKASRTIVFLVLKR